MEGQAAEPRRVGLDEKLVRVRSRPHTRTLYALQTAVNTPDASRLSLKQQSDPHSAKAAFPAGGLSEAQTAEDCETPLDEKDIEEQATPRPEETFYPDGGLRAWSVVFVRHLSRRSCHCTSTHQRVLVDCAYRAPGSWSRASWGSAYRPASSSLTTRRTAFRIHPRRSCNFSGAYSVSHKMPQHS